jgi:hypothetical protein
MTSGEYEKPNRGTVAVSAENAPAVDSGDSESAKALSLLLWSGAALMELLVLAGGLMWIVSGPGAIGTPVRVALVALAAVCGGGAFALAAARKST